MKTSIHQYFRLGTLQWMSYPKEDEISALRRLCEDDFFDVIETKGYGDRTEEAAAMLRTSGLGVCYGAHPHILGQKLNPNAIDETERKKAESALLAMVDDAVRIGAEGIAFLSGKWEEATKEEAFGQLLKTTRTLCCYAGKAGLTVELEVFDYDVDKCALIGPAPLAARFAEEIRKDCPNFGLLVDLSHIPITHETSAETVGILKPYITHFHYGNAVMDPECDGYGDKHPRLGYPNGCNGVEELTEYLRVLRREGFFRPEKPFILSMEVTPRPGEEEQTVVANTKRMLRRAWAMLEEE